MDPRNSGNCNKCGYPGHWERNCKLERAKTPAEHEARIRLLGERYADKEITQEEKRRLVEIENELWKDETGAKAK